MKYAVKRREALDSYYCLIVISAKIMKKTKLLKFALLEFIQWTAFAATIFVTAQKFATISDYWLVVASSIGYVAVSTLCIWLPVKYAIQWRKIWSFFENQWNPSIALYVALCSLPCCIVSMVGMSIVPEIDFQSVCSELLIIMLLVVDIAEKFKRYKLRGEENEEDEEITGVGNRAAMHSRSGAYAIISSRRSSYANSRYSSNFCWTDKRLSELLENFLSAYDVRLVLGMVGYNFELIEFNWYFPIYVFGFISMGSFILTAHCKYRIFVNVVLMDLPFFFLRLSILCVYGEITNVLFLLKNFLALSSFVYFWGIRPRVFKEFPNRPITVNTIESSMANGGNRSQDNFYEHDGPYEDRSRADTFDDYHVRDGDQPGGELYNYNDEQHQSNVNRTFHESQLYDHDHDDASQDREQSFHVRRDHEEQADPNPAESRESFRDLRSDHPAHEQQLQPPDNSNDQQVVEYDHAEPSSHYQAIRGSKKSPRKSIVKENVFSPLSEKVTNNDESENDQETEQKKVVYASVKKKANNRESSKSSSNRKSEEQQKLENAPPLVSADSSDKENLDSIPAPPDFTPTPSSSKLQSLRYSVRDTSFTPALAAQIAKEAIQRRSTRTKRESEDTSMDVQL